MAVMRIVKGLCAVACTLMVTVCDDNPALLTPGSGGSSGGATVLITSTGFVPRNVTVERGAQVTFVNNDNRTHEIRSDPHPGHGDCAAVNEVGVIQPGNSRQTGNLTTARTCGFHDEESSDSAFQGTVLIQ